ncbi:ATP-binding protein [Bradyrhizobium sp. AZCC 2289]|uniref:ATP-binding protein n=1 Tax=Bradyrhizobium sp. AZCC 2289 TaxID=3117026 RepID=UPI003FA6023E
MGDSGPGLAAPALERVFEAFYSTKLGGLGLGLSICRSIIEAHNGRLWASPNVPCGAIFGFIAPTHPAAIVSGVPLRDLRHGRHRVWQAADQWW